MSLRLALAVLVSLATGFLLVSLAWPGGRRFGPSGLPKLSLAVGLGLGVSAEVYFVCLWAGIRSTTGLVLADLLVLAGLAAARFRLGSRRADRPAGSSVSAAEVPASVWVERILTIGVALALIPAAYAFASAFLNQPHGGWDAWMSWNLRARFFFRAGEHWREAFSPLFWGANPEYPVLLPSAVARLWQLAGRETESAPALVAALFTFATIALACSSLRLLRSRAQGLLAGILLLGSPLFVQHGTFQMADVPIGFYFLASIATLCLGERAPGSRARAFFLTGLAAGFAVWTKNEGTLFLAALILAGVVVLARRGELRASVRGVLAFAGGLVVVLPLAVAAKVSLAPPDIMLSWNRERLHAVVEWGRYAQILRAFASEAWHLGGFRLPILPVLALSALLLGIDRQQLRFRSTAIALAALSLTLAGYAAVYLTTPQDLAWHLRTSLPRLLLQLWPSAVFVYFLLLETPEQALAKAPVRSASARA